MGRLSVAAMFAGFVVAVGGASTAASTTGEIGWNRTDLRPVTQPVAMGGRVVFYAAVRGALRLVAVEGRTGATDWSLAATTSSIAPGEPAFLTVVGGRVVFLAAGATGVARVAAVDPANGRVAWSVPGVFTAWPSVCPDRPVALCISGRLVTGARDLAIRLDPTNGATLVAPVLPTAVGREIGAGLFETGERSPERLAAVNVTKVSWVRRLKEIFPLAGVTTDYGWNVDRLSRVGLFVGSVAGGPLKVTASRVTIDLAREMTVGFRIADGRVAWRDRGSLFACSILPCVDTTPTNFSSSRDIDAAAPRVGLRVRQRGTVSYPISHAARPLVSAEARTTLEGFAMRTGRTLWSFDVGRDVGLITFEDVPPRVRAGAIALRDARGRTVELDLVTGATVAVRPGTVVWCQPSIGYTLRATYQSRLGRSNRYVGQNAVVPCTPAKKGLSPRVRVPALVGRLGARIGSLAVWADAKGLHSAPVAG